MKTAIELLRVTPTNRLARGRASTVVTFSVVEDRDPVGRVHAYIMAGVICPPPNGSGRLHKVEARIYSPYGNNAPTWIVCDCEDECVCGHTMISTIYGEAEIGNLVDQELEVFSRSGVQPTKVFATGTAETRLLTAGDSKARGGFRIRATNTERFLVLCPDLTTTWRRLDKIKQGDYVALLPGAAEPQATPKISYAPQESTRARYQRRIRGKLTWVSGGQTHHKDQRVPRRMTKALARVLGFLVSEGYTDHNSIDVFQKDRDARDAYEQSFRTCFPDAHLTLRGRQDKKGKSVFCRSVVLTGFLRHVGYATGKKCWHREVPQIVFRSPSRFVREFLRAAFEGDGGCTSKQVYYSTTSAKLARQVQSLLLRFGILGAVHGYRRAAPRKKMWQVTLSGVDAVRFREQIGFLSPQKNNTEVHENQTGRVFPYVRKCLRAVRKCYDSRLDRDISHLRLREKSLRRYLAKYGADLESTDRKLYDRVRDLLSSPVRWVPVKSIGRKKMVPTYDAAVVRGDPEFTANGFVVHNTYRWQTARTVKDSGSNVTSNGKMPNVRNPQMIFAVCKHMARVLTRAIKDARVRKIIFGLPLDEITNPRYPGRAPVPKLTGRK